MWFIKQQLEAHKLNTVLALTTSHEQGSKIARVITETLQLITVKF